MIEGVVKVVEGPAQRLSGTQGSVCRVCRQKRVAEPAKQFRHGHARLAIAKIHRRIVNDGISRRPRRKVAAQKITVQQGRHRIIPIEK